MDTTNKQPPSSRRPKVRKPFLIVILGLLVLGLVLFGFLVRNSAMKPYISSSGLRSIYQQKQNEYLLQPDARCLSAVSILDTRLLGHASEELSLTFDSSARHWKISLGERMAGTLPEFADVDDCYSLLESMVVAAGLPPAPASQADSSETAQFNEPTRLLGEMHKIDTGEPLSTLTSSQRKQLASGLGYLLLQSIDLTGSYDAIVATALATSVWSDATTGRQDTSTRALISHLMGYGKAAQQYAAQLPESSVVRLYVLRQDELLFAATQKQSDDPLVRYLNLRRRAEQKDFSGWTATVSSYPVSQRLSIPIWQTAMILSAFRHQHDADIMPLVIVMQVRALAEGNDPEDWSQLIQRQGIINDIYALLDLMGLRAAFTTPVIDAFETSVKATGADYAGAVINASLTQEYFRAYFYSTLYRVAMFKLKTLASIEEADAWLEYLGSAKSEQGGDFSAWYRALVTAEKGEMNLPELTKAVKEHPRWGQVQDRRIFRVIKDNYLAFGKRSNQGTVKLVSSRLDSRPENAAFLSDVLRSALYELDYSERLISFAAANDSVDDIGQSLYLAALQGDTDKLKILVNTPHVDISDKRYAADSLAVLLEEENQGDGGVLESVFKQAPDDFNTVYWYVSHLLERKRFDELRQHAQTWLELNQPDPGLERASMQILIAQSYYDEGQYELAWASLEPALVSYKSQALTLGAWALFKLGQQQESDELWQRALKRYGHTEGFRYSRLEFLWATGAFDAATEFLGSWPRSLRPDDWVYRIAPVFFKALGDDNDETIVKAIQALRSGKFDVFLNLRYLSAPFKKEGRYETALKIRSAMGPVYGPAWVEMATENYKMLREVQDEATALEWLAKQIPGKMLSPSSMVFFKLGNPELLWTLVRPYSGIYPEWVWLIRAAASVRYGPPAPEYQSQLTTYYVGKKPDYLHKIRRLLNFPGGFLPEPQYPHTLGRYLLGLEQESTLFNLQVYQDSLYEVAYFIALKNHCEGNLREASNWYHIVLDLTTDSIGEYHWAHNQLFEWYTRGRVLNNLEPECGRR